MQKPQQATISLIHGIVFLVSIIIATVMYLNELQAFWSVYLLGGICLAGWLINRAGHSKSSAFLLIGSILAVVQYNLYIGYGIHDVAVIAWPTVIFFVGLMVGSEVIPYFTLVIMLSGFVARFIPNAQNFIGNTDKSDFVVMLVILSAFSLTAWRLIRGNEISLRQLKQSEERAQAIFNSVNDAILINDAHTCSILDVNQKFQELFGYTCQEAIQQNIEAFSSGISPYRREDAIHWLEKASTQGPQIFEWQAKNKNGHVFWVEVNMKLAVIGGQSRVVISMRDIGDRKQAEDDLRSLNEHLEERVRERTTQLEIANQELEAFSYSVSHDLRAPLRHLNGFSSILLEDYQDRLDEQGQQYLNQIQGASLRMGQLINDLLNLSRISRAGFTRQTVNLSALAKEIAKELQMQAPQRQVDFEISDNLMVRGDGNLIKIALENLINNAFKFTSQRNKARIQIGRLDQPGESIYFIRDNGAGFRMDYANKLFAPFQRLHSEQEFPGSGIGLATVKRIINRHGGRIWVEAVVNQGATFYFTFLPKDSL